MNPKLQEGRPRIENILAEMIVARSNFNNAFRHENKVNNYRMNRRLIKSMYRISEEQYRELYQIMRGRQ